MFTVFYVVNMNAQSIITFNGSGILTYRTVNDTLKKYGFPTSIVVVINEGITTIDNEAFINCNTLISISFPKSLEYIGESAFENCSSLMSITLPDKLAFISHKAFINCIKLEEIICLRTTPPRLGAFVFDYIKYTCKIYVPEESVYAYENDYGWSSYANLIKAKQTP